LRLSSRAFNVLDDCLSKCKLGQPVCQVTSTSRLPARCSLQHLTQTLKPIAHVNMRRHSPGMRRGNGSRRSIAESPGSIRIKIAALLPYLGIPRFAEPYEDLASLGFVPRRYREQAEHVQGSHVQAVFRFAVEKRLLETWPRDVILSKEPIGPIHEADVQRDVAIDDRPLGLRDSDLGQTDWTSRSQHR